MIKKKETKKAHAVSSAGWVISPLSSFYLFLAASGLRLIFLLLSLFFFGGSGLACMCLPCRLGREEKIGNSSVYTGNAWIRTNAGIIFSSYNEPEVFITCHNTKLTCLEDEIMAIIRNKTLLYCSVYEMVTGMDTDPKLQYLI